MPEANGGLERAVANAKKILTQENSDLALLNYRTTPYSATGINPAEALMGRLLKTRLPTLSENLMPKLINKNEAAESDSMAKEQYQFFYDRRHGAHPLPAIQAGQLVAVKLTHKKRWESSSLVALAAPDTPQIPYTDTKWERHKE